MNSLWTVQVPASWQSAESAEVAKWLAPFGRRDGDGEVVAQETDRRVVESGEFEKEVDVRLRLSPEQLAAGALVRIELSSVPD